MFPHTFLEKVFGTKQRNQAKLYRSRKLWYLFLGIFWLLQPKFYFAKSLSTKYLVVWQLLKWIGYNAYYTRYQVLLCIWWIETVLKCCKVAKYYVQDWSVSKTFWEGARSTGFWLKNNGAQFINWDLRDKNNSWPCLFRSGLKFVFHWNP